MPKTYIIAEAGVNHDGELHKAIQLVDVAIMAGADAVKFQTFRSNNIVCAQEGKAEYQKRTTPPDESQLSMLQKLELDVSAHKTLMQHCKEKGIEFLSTPFDLASVDLLGSLGLTTFKVPSGEITHLPYLRRVAEHAKDVILSTGMADINEIRAALSVLVHEGIPANNIVLLHCNTAYPTPPEDVNLRAMPAMLDNLDETFPGLRIGFSDHSIGIEAPLAAVALGASVVEKHFTLDKNAAGPDHQASLSPQELKDMVSAIRLVETMLGSVEKSVTDSERENLKVVRKSIVAATSISAGEFFTEDNLICKRPGTGLSPMLWDEVIGQKAKRDFQPDEAVKL